MPEFRRLQVDAPTNSTATGSLLAHSVPDRFNLSVCDNGMPIMCTSASIVVSVGDKNEPPSLASASIGVSENSAGNSTVGTPLVASDVDAGDSLSVQITSGPTITNIFCLVSTPSCKLLCLLAFLVPVT